jgi:hypothetical protein
VQIVEGFEGAVTDPPGKAVPAPGVSGGGVPITNVEVGRARKVGVTAAGAAGEPHAVSTGASRIKLIRKTRSHLVFIVISSFTACLTMTEISESCSSSRVIISRREKKNARIGSWH